MIERITVQLPHGIDLDCRVTGPDDGELLVFLHGFPEAAFVWDPLLAHFGTRYRCVAPNLRGYGESSSPAEVSAYRAKHLVQDILALIEANGRGPVAALVGHDWGGAVAWALAAAHPNALRRLVILNAPHPAVFLRALQESPAQQAASAYMNFMCRADAGSLLREHDHARLFAMFTNMGALDGPDGGWLTESLRAQYRAVWERGLEGMLHYYRASSLRPPQAPDDPMLRLVLPTESVTIGVPTTVLWGEADTALPASLLDGLDAFVPDLTLVRIAEATHWLVHEVPARVARELDAALARKGT